MLGVARAEQAAVGLLHQVIDVCACRDPVEITSQTQFMRLHFFLEPLRGL